MSAPTSRQRGFVDLIPNLLLTTLAVVAVALPPGKQLSFTAPQQKAPVVATQFLNYSTLGINPNPRAVQLSESAPPPKYSVQCEQPQNTRGTTLFVATYARGATLGQYQGKAAVWSDTPVNRLPLSSAAVSNPFTPLDTSAVLGKSEVRDGQAVNRLPLIGSPLRPVDTSSAQLKYQVRADQVVNYTALGINPNPVVRQLDSSAPAIKAPVVAEQQPNLLPLGSVVAPAPFLPVDTSRLQPKGEVRADQFLNYSTLGINPNPATVQHSSSAPAAKAAVQADQFPALLTLAPHPNPAAEQLASSAPSAKRAVQVDLYPNLSVTTLASVATPSIPVDTSAWQGKWAVRLDLIPNYLPIGINPNPQAVALSTSAPPPKYAVQVDVYPDLTTTTLAVTFPAPPLPLGLPVDVFQYQSKYQVQVDAYPNTVLLGIPTAPPVVPPVTDQNSGGWPLYVYLEQQTYRQRQAHEESQRVRKIARENARQDDIQAEIAERLHAELARQQELDDLQRLRLLVARHSRLEGVPDAVQRAFERARAQQSFSRLQALQREFAKSLEEEEMALLMILLEDG